MKPPRVPKYPPPQVVPGPRIERLVAELADGADRADALAAFWADVAVTGTPLVTARDGEPGHRTVTFLWRDPHGAGPGTQDVVLLANKLTDPSVWPASTLERIPGTDVWHRSYRLRADWRATYQLAPLTGAAAETPGGPPSRWGAAAASAIPDSLNRRTFGSRYGAAPHSVVELPDAPPQPWCAARDDTPAGTVRAHRLAGAVLGNERDVWVYTPGGHGPGSAPAELLVLLDGEDWATRLPAATVLDNLIAEGRIPPTVAVMVSTIDTATRWRELACSAPFLAFLVGELLPWAREVAGPVDPAPGATTVAGRSLGGLTALDAALRAPEHVGRVLSQSASLWWPSGTEFDAGAGAIVDRIAAAEPPVASFFLEVGLQEWVLLARHRHLRDVLALKGCDVTYREYNGGHDAICWQGGLADGLVALAGAGAGAAAAAGAPAASPVA